MVGAVLVAGLPDPKSRTLDRGVRRYRRKVASPRQWQAIHAAKGYTCRMCGRKPVQYHHLVERDAPHFGDDVADNIVPLCTLDHALITRRHKLALYRLAEALTDAEYAYVVGKVGEDAMRLVFGVEARP